LWVGLSVPNRLLQRDLISSIGISGSAVILEMIACGVLEDVEKVVI